MKRQLEEELLLLIFKFGFQNVEEVLVEMKPTIRERFEERLKTIFDSGSRPSVAESEPELEPELESELEPVVTEPTTQVSEPIPKGTNEKKKAQRDAEKKKREENEANGIFVADLLTEQNLRTWKAARHSNAYIAREFVGCREEDVAKAIKKFGISNPVV